MCVQAQVLNPVVRCRFVRFVYVYLITLVVQGFVIGSVRLVGCSDTPRVARCGRHSLVLRAHYTITAHYNESE